MGIQDRKKREKGERRRLIQNAAKELFLKKGFNSTTMEDIATKAELSAATIYLYFKNKEELYGSLNLIIFQFLSDKIKKIYTNKNLSVGEKIFKFKDAMFQAFKYDPLIYRNIMHIQLEDTLSNINRDLVDKINKEARDILRMFANVYQEGVRQGKFVRGHDIGHADVMYALFIGLVLWEEAKRKLNPEKNFLKPTLDMAFNIFYRGIKKN